VCVCERERGVVAHINLHVLELFPTCWLVCLFHPRLHILKRWWMKIMGFKDRGPIHPVVQTCSIHRNRSICKHMVDEKMILKPMIFHPQHLDDHTW